MSCFKRNWHKNEDTRLFFKSMTTWKSVSYVYWWLLRLLQPAFTFFSREVCAYKNFSFAKWINLFWRWNVLIYFFDMAINFLLEPIKCLLIMRTSCCVYCFTAKQKCVYGHVDKRHINNSEVMSHGYHQISGTVLCWKPAVQFTDFNNLFGCLGMRTCCSEGNIVLHYSFLKALVTLQIQILHQI